MLSPTKRYLFSLIINQNDTRVNVFIRQWKLPFLRQILIEKVIV